MTGNCTVISQGTNRKNALNMDALDATFLIAKIVVLRESAIHKVCRLQMPHAMTSDFVNTTGQVSSLGPCRHHGDDSHGASHAADICHTCDTCLVWQCTIGLEICLCLSAVQHWNRTGNCNFVILE